MLRLAITIIPLALFLGGCEANVCIAAQERLQSCGVDVPAPETCGPAEQAAAEKVLALNCEAFKQRNATARKNKPLPDCSGICTPVDPTACQTATDEAFCRQAVASNSLDCFDCQDERQRIEEENDRIQKAQEECAASSSWLGRWLCWL